MLKFLDSIKRPYPVLAQGWWPWSSSEHERAPVPDEPVYREPPPPGGEPPTMQPPIAPIIP